MSSPAALDLAALLRPISDAEPTGTELKDDPARSAIYYRIKDARDSARAAERQWVQAALYGEDANAGSLPPPNWKLVQELAVDALASHSKDLWVAAWLIEALVRRHGFAGLRDGFRLARELSEQFWDAIHPRPDDEGYGHTVAQLTGLYGDQSEGALVAPILAIPLTHGGTLRPLSSIDYQQATQLEQIPDPERRAQRIEKGAVTLAMFERAAQETPDDWYQTLLADLDACLDEFSLLNQVLEVRCGQNADGYSAAPPASQLRTTLEECRDRVRSLTRRLVSAGAAEPQASGTAGLTAVSTPGALAAAKVITREDAFRALLQVADFFRTTEPHSPVSYALEQAVRWGRMALPELMAELVADETARQEIFRRVGIPKPPASE